MDGVPENLWQFLSSQEHNLLVCAGQNPDELGLYFSINELYFAVIKRFQSPDNGLRNDLSDVIIAQLFTFSHGHFYQGMAHLLRGHFADAFHSVRTTIDAGLHAYLIIEGGGTARQYLDGDEIFQKAKRTINNARRANPDAYDIAPYLMELHGICSRYASHADSAVFRNRTVLNPGENGFSVDISYFQHEPQPDMHKLNMMMYLEAHLCVVSIFEIFFLQRGIVDEKWQNEKVDFAKAVVGYKDHLKGKLGLDKKGEP